jgi:uncharacterized protein (TIGR03083 family)
METAVIDTALVAPLGHGDAMGLAETEFGRIVAQLSHLSPEDWGRRTVCELWDVRALATHVLGMAEAQASFRQFVHDFRAASKRAGGKMIDAMTATQVGDDRRRPRRRSSSASPRSPRRPCGPAGAYRRSCAGRCA